MPAVNHIEKGVKTFQAKLLMMMAENFLLLLHSRNSVILFRNNKTSGIFLTFFDQQLISSSMSRSKSIHLEYIFLI